ncbi:unnamed protein product [Linum tenue]|uniref:ATP synthase F0 subunit 8 n=1 Tax=Linum tenue TaxID=586396 RepID=A0AAV0GT69_9ROSI|nr:unnamed protein product [Linum tenue]
MLNLLSFLFIFKYYDPFFIFIFIFVFRRWRDSASANLSTLKAKILGKAET